MEDPSVQKVPIPRIDTASTWVQHEEEAVENRLLSVIAQVLDMPRDQLLLHESFRDLGGDDRSAVALRAECLEIGIDIKVSDILRCPTLAELQTCIIPKYEYPEIRNLPDTMPPVEPLEIQRPARLSVTRDANPIATKHSRTSSQASSGSQAMHMTEIEKALGSQKEISRIATVRPKAGILEGKLVALFTLSATQSSRASSSDVSLISQSNSIFAGTQVTFLRQVAKSLLPPTSLPDIWIVLDSMPLTESGHVDTRRLRTWVQNMNQQLYYQVSNLQSQVPLEEPKTTMERSLQRLVSKVLALSQVQIGVNLSFCQLGGDETTAMELVARCKNETIYINPLEVLGSNTLSELAAIAESRSIQESQWEEETRDYFDLSPMQHLYFESSMGGDLNRRSAGDGSYRFNLSLFLRFKKDVCFEDVAAALEAVVAHHPMLRSRYSRGPGGWMQLVLPDVAGSYNLRRHSISSDRELDTIIGQTQLAIDIERGPVFAADYFTTHDGQQLIYLAAHHLAVDLPSWRIIIHDLDELLDSGSFLSQRSMPFHKWVELQKSDVQGRDPKEFVPFKVQPGDYTFWGLREIPNAYGDTKDISFALSSELTAILQNSCNQVFKTDTVDIYLAALMLSFAQTFPDRSVPVVWNQEHGRDMWTSDIDISETVGWFTALCPIAQKVEGTDDFIEVLRHLKDTRRSIPAHGSKYFASRFYNNAGPDTLRPDWPFEVMFTYAGSLQQLERTNGVMEQLPLTSQSFDSPTSDIGSKVGRVALFEISAMLDKGIAKVSFTYSKFCKDQTRIAQWAHNYEHLLLEAIGRLRYHPHELTLADVPHLDVTYEGLTRFNKQRVAGLKLASVQDVETIYPVTAVHQAILISQAQRPDACYLHAIYEFASPHGDSIDIARLCNAWQHVCIRHPALRTVFTESVSETGLWDMVILRRASPDMLFIDTAPAEDPVYELDNLPDLRPTDNKPLHRLTVCRAPTRTFIKLDISTALCDSVSIHLLLHDLRRAYVTEKAIPEPAHFGYPHYMQFLSRIRRESSVGFWREMLSDVAPCMFPRLTVSPDEQRFVNSFLNLEITSYELSGFTRSHATTVDAIVRLAWSLVLRCFTGSNAVCFGYQTTGRDDTVSELQNAVGSFANMVACKYELTSYTPLKMALEVIEDQLTASLPHQHFTMTELEHAMGMKGGEHLFNSCLTFTEEPAGLNSKFTTRTSFELKPLSLKQTSDVDVLVNTRFAGGKLVVDIGQRVMSEEQALNVANTFGKAIRTILSAPHSSIGTVDLFSDRDYAQLLAWGVDSPSGNNTRVESVVHELVSKQARAQPNSQAVCAWDGTFTYQKLDEEATVLAHHLVDVGVGPHSVVPVVMEKSRLAIVAILAVLKAGGAFVPIDALELGLIQPIFERLNFSRVAVASERAALVLGNLFDDVVTLNDDLMFSLPRDRRSLTSMATPSDPACILFSRVSSGEARGVSFSHTALSTALVGQGPAARIGPLSRVMQLSSFNVDICVSEILTTLAYGGCVCVPAVIERLKDFAGAVNRMQVNWTYMTPHLSRKVDPARVPTLKAVCFRTRSLDEDTYSAWHGKANIILAYGPHDVCPLGISFLEVVGANQLRSVGRPFCGSFMVVNPDDRKNLVPVGAVGELVVEGPTLGCHYPNRESTLGPMSPLGPSAGNTSRYFKTGHRVRYTDGGLMEFISHKHDDAVGSKSRPVDTAQIEQYLRRCLGQGVDVLVDKLPFRATDDAPVLGAFIEFGDSILDGEDDLASLGATAKEQLFIARQLVEIGLQSNAAPPGIPSIFIPVKHLPITPSLKVNKRRLQKMISGLSKEKLIALCAASTANDAKLKSFKPLPLTDSEERMRAIWAKVLGIEESCIRACDGFFGVGGDHVLAAQLVTACRHEGISINIADVLQNVTLTGLCRTMSSVEPLQPDSPVSLPVLNPSPTASDPNAVKQGLLENVIAPKVGVDAHGIKDAAEATSTQIRHMETGMLRGRANINYFTFMFTGAVDPKKLEDACLTLVTIHPILRTALVPHNRKVYQAVIKSANVEFKRHTCPTWRLNTVMEKSIRKDQASPVAFCSPMTKFIFIDGGKQSILILRLSKGQYDDLSMGLFVKDLKKLYDGTQNPPRRPTYCEFVRSVQLANSQGAEEYWKKLLEGSTVTHVVEHSLPYRVSANTKTLRQVMPLGSLSSLGISYETILKSAWAMVLASLSASSDVVFGELVDGRHVTLSHNQSVMGVMGPTINQIPVRVQFPDTPLTPLGLLQYVQTQRISSIPFENLGTLNIVEKCTPWPYWTRFSTLIQHQYEDTAIVPAEPKSFHLGNASCNFTVVESRAQDVPDLFIRSIARGNNRVELSVTFCVDRVPETFADEALRMVCATINLLTSVNIMQPLIPSGYQYKATEKRIPLPLRDLLDACTAHISAGRSDAVKALTKDQEKAIQTVISKAWTSVINPRALGVPEAQVHMAAFFDLWGSLIPAAQLATQLNRELPKAGIPGIDASVLVTMEEIVENPTMAKQFELIAVKMKNKPNSASSSSSLLPLPKGKDKEKGKDTAVDNKPTSNDSTRLAPIQAAIRRKPSINLAVASVKGTFRRFASTVGRSGSESPAKTSSSASGQSTTMAIGIASAMVAELVSPFSPNVVSANINARLDVPGRQQQKQQQQQQQQQQQRQQQSPQVVHPGQPAFDTTDSELMIPSSDSEPSSWRLQLLPGAAVELPPVAGPTGSSGGITSSSRRGTEHTIGSSTSVATSVATDGGRVGGSGSGSARSSRYSGEEGRSGGYGDQVVGGSALRVSQGYHGNGNGNGNGNVPAVIDTAAANESWRRGDVTRGEADDIVSPLSAVTPGKYGGRLFFGNGGTNGSMAGDGMGSGSGLTVRGSPDTTPSSAGGMAEALAQGHGQGQGQGHRRTASGSVLMKKMGMSSVVE
ncbi:hypothetical protein QBC45DRAFT_211717 [Copromyces sp. CBS 386.78]|nr:hypothetical protein QBC45DRAFT_211717 [Copromyces sp. CBS 386.78]